MVNKNILHLLQFVRLKYETKGIAIFNIRLKKYFGLIYMHTFEVEKELAKKLQVQFFN